MALFNNPPVASKSLRVLARLLGYPDAELRGNLAKLRQALHDERALPPQQRDAVLLVYGEDLSHREAGEALGCTEATLSWHLHAARKKLKAVIGGDGSLS